MEQGTLKGLQELDLAIRDQRKLVESFEPRLEEVDGPALALESEVDSLARRLEEVQKEERRLERSADDKRARSKMLEERLKSVRNLREEAAVSAEQDLLRRALEADEQEAYTLLDQIRRAETQLGTLREELEEARSQVEPQREQLLRERDEARETLRDLESRRSAYADSVPGDLLRVYESIKAGDRAVVVADLTHDGACSYCYSLVPLQIQQEIRGGGALIRCEACGVILSASDEEEGEASS